MKDTRNLPAEVLSRLQPVIADDRPGEQVRMGLDAVQRSQIVEARLARPEFRVDEHGAGVLDGYATVYDWPYDVAGGAPMGWTETIAAGACAKSISEGRDRVGLLVNHDSDTALGLPLASNYAGTLELESDKHGLRTSCTLTPSNVVSAFLIDALRAGNADSMSFAFRVVRQEWNDDYTQRTIRELQLFDVSVVTYPANPAAVAQLRSERIAAANAGMPLDLALAEARRLHLARR